LLPIQPIALDCIVPEWRNWQTRMVQVHVLARVWGFESLLRHQFSAIQSDQTLRNHVKVSDEIFTLLNGGDSTDPNGSFFKPTQADQSGRPVRLHDFWTGTWESLIAVYVDKHQ
jgi:hypothetical protein